jgi:hypothetical protein
MRVGSLTSLSSKSGDNKFSKKKTHKLLSRCFICYDKRRSMCQTYTGVNRLDWVDEHERCKFLNFSALCDTRLPQFWFSPKKKNRSGGKISLEQYFVRTIYVNHSISSSVNIVTKLWAVKMQFHPLILFCFALTQTTNYLLTKSWCHMTHTNIYTLHLFWISLLNLVFKFSEKKESKCAIEPNIPVLDPNMTEYCIQWSRRDIRVEDNGMVFISVYTVARDVPHSHYVHPCKFFSECIGQKL